MISFKKFQRSHVKDAVFSILIPSWNNLDYLKLCVESIQNNSFFQHQIIVAINEGADGTKEWVKQQTELDYIFADENIGICYALNACRSLIATEYVVYANDDMYFLPNWDQAIWNEITNLSKNSKSNNNFFMISGTLIEPSGNNPCVVIKDYGTDIESFKKTELLNEYQNLYRQNWFGSTWPPIVVPLSCWDLVGGMSIEFHPGMYSDPDLSRKLWEMGVRNFIGVGNSLIYHFGCKSTKRIRQNKGSKTFSLKWGISSKTFTDRFLLRGQAMTTPNNNFLETPNIPWIINVFNRIKSYF